MTRSHHALLAPLVLLPAVLFAQAPMPASDAIAETVNLDKFTVTAASGVTESVFKIPMTIDLVTSSDATNTQPLWIGEIMNQLPGVFFAQLRGPIDAPAIRLPVSYDNTELYLQDNVPLQSAINFNHAAFAYSGALTSFGGIEVLKGPGSALHGSDAFAAVINVLSQAPSETFTGGLRASVGAYGLREFRGDVSNDLGSGQAFRLAASYGTEDGWRRLTGWERKQAIVRHSLKKGMLEAQTILTATRYESEAAGAQTAAIFFSDPRNDGLAAAVPRDQAKGSTEYLRLSSEIKLTLSPTVSIISTPYVRSIEQTGMAVWIPATVPIYTDKTKSTGWLNRAYFDWSRNSQTVVGVDFESTRLDTMTEQVLPDAFVFGSLYPQGKHYDYQVDYTNIAPFVQHTETFGERWVLVAGLRYEDARYDYDNRLSSGTVAAFYRPADRKDRFDALNPKLGLTYLLSPTQSLHARYAHGFRIPSAASLYSLSAGQTDFRLKPEQIDSYEVGYKAGLGSRASLTASAYLMRSRDGLTTGLSTPAGTITANGGRREYKGIEVQLATRLTETVRAVIAYGFQDHEIVSDRPDGSDPRRVNGKTPNSAPANLGNLGITWTPTIGGKRVVVDYDLQWLGAWWMDDSNTAKTDDEFISNLRVRYELTKNWTVTAKALNLFDRFYASTAANTGFGVRYRPGPPLTVSGGLEYSW